MRIGIDAHHLNGKPQGSRTYLIHLIRALSQALSDADELRVFSFDPMASRELVPGTHHRIFPRSAKLRLPLVVPALELLHGLDLFHSQYVAPPLSAVPEIVSIYDVLFESHPELFRDAFGARSRALIRRSARRAGAVLTASEFSRQAILEYYRIPEERVVVVGAAVDHSRYRVEAEPPRELLERYGLERPFVLSVGRLEPRKNLERLIRAFGRRELGAMLVVVGTSDFRYRSIFEAAEAVPHSRVKLLGAVPDEDLPGLYRLAEALAYPSLVEGFGMPLLEAMACGTPVVTTRRGALPEVAGDAALYVEPEDEASIAEGLSAVLADGTLRERLRARGLERAALFTWEATARRTLEAYRRVL